MNSLEIFGYVASILVAISLMLTSIVKLRIVNAIGSAAFALYGVLVQAYPVAFLNGFIVCINLYHLYKLLNTKEKFITLEFNADGTVVPSAFLDDFVNTFADDIKKYFPAFTKENIGMLKGFFIARDIHVAGLFLGKKIDDTTFLVEIDYIVPQYRDFKAGDHIFKTQKQFFYNLGCTRVRAYSWVRKHSEYLERVGFKQVEQRENYTVYELSLS